MNLNADPPVRVELVDGALHRLLVRDEREYMKKQSWLLASAFLMALVAVSPAAAQPSQDSQNQEASGGFSLNVHSHSSDDPNDPTLRFPTERLAYPIEEGDTFSYSSRPCNLPAPFNEVGLEFNPAYPGFDNPTAVRHHSAGTIVDGDSEKGTIEGTIKTVICEDDDTESEHSITTAYRGHYDLVSPDEARITGPYEIVDGTGTFENLSGNGSIQASLTCLRDATCEDLGHFTDFVAPPPPSDLDPERPGLRGSYRDPDVTTG